MDAFNTLSTLTSRLLDVLANRIDAAFDGEHSESHAEDYSELDMYLENILYVIIFSKLYERFPRLPRIFTDIDEFVSEHLMGSVEYFTGDYTLEELQSRAQVVAESEVVQKEVKGIILEWFVDYRLGNYVLSDCLTAIFEADVIVRLHEAVRTLYERGQADIQALANAPGRRTPCATCNRPLRPRRRV